MAQKSKPKTSRKISYRGFEGVNVKKTHSGDESVALIENFRITEDGSLKKRSGFKNIYQNPYGKTRINATYCTVENGNEVYYFTEGMYLKKYIVGADELITLGALSDSDTHVFFFKYQNVLYVCDGIRLHTVTGTDLQEATTYIPLYGKDWPSTTSGEIYEPLNLLCPKVAISYKFQAPAQGFLAYGNLKIASVDAIYRNGELLDESQYVHDKLYRVVTIYDHEDTDRYLAIYTIEMDRDLRSEHEALLYSQAASVFPELNNNNVLFWGSRLSNKIFYSKTVNSETAKLTQGLIVPNGNLYVPTNSSFSVGLSDDRVNTLIRHYDRVLIMTDESTWITDLQELGKENFKIKNINASIGCTSFGGAIRNENTLISVGKNAIYAWTADTDELNECNAYSISDPIKPFLSDSFFTDCIISIYEKQREIWFYGVSQNELWIYNLNNKAWYKFSGFSPQVFLNGSKEIGFFFQGGLYVFDPSLLADTYVNSEREIVARMKSGELEFNSKHPKKLASATLRSEFSGGALNLSLLLDSSKSVSEALYPTKGHSILPFRIKTGSFRSLSFELIAYGMGEQTIHGIEMDAI